MISKGHLAQAMYSQARLFIKATDKALQLREMNADHLMPVAQCSKYQERMDIDCG